MGTRYDPKYIRKRIKDTEHNLGIAFTYNEPVVWYEFMYDIARELSGTEFKTAMISNGYINPEPLKELIPFIDAFNIDLKAFTETFYRSETGAKLNPVLESIKTISDSGKHLEITMLVIPGLNDSIKEFTEMTDWIADNCNADVVLHLSRYFPRYKSQRQTTSIATLRTMYNIASTKIKYVFPGNVATYDW